MIRNTRKLQDRRNHGSSSASQLSLRFLLVLTFAFALSVLFLRELSVRYGMVAVFVAALAALSIFAHIAGAAIGSRLRALEPASNQLDTDSESEESATALPQQPLQAKETDFAPRTELSQQQPLTRKPIYWSVGIGASLGATLACVILTVVTWENLAIANVAFGAGSAAVIGGLIGFWVSSFFQVVRSALADAQKES